MTKCGLILGVWAGLIFKNQSMSFTIVKTKMKNHMILLIDAEKKFDKKIQYLLPELKKYS